MGIEIKSYLAKCDVPGCNGQLHFLDEDNLAKVVHFLTEDYGWEFTGEGKLICHRHAAHAPQKPSESR